MILIFSKYEIFEYRCCIYFVFYNINATLHYLMNIIYALFIFKPYSGCDRIILNVDI